MIEIKYGLRNKKTGKIVKYETQNNGKYAEGVDTTYLLVENEYAKSEWLVDTPEHAEYVRMNSTPWYNAGYDTPLHDLFDEVFEVVQIKRSMEIITYDVKLPNAEEFARIKYGKTDPRHLKYILSEVKKYGHKLQFSWYDYSEWIREEKNG